MIGNWICFHTEAPTPPGSYLAIFSTDFGSQQWVPHQKIRLFPQHLAPKSENSPLKIERQIGPQDSRRIGA